MSDVEVLPELKEIVGAVLFAARQPVSVDRLHEVFGQAAERIGGVARDYAAVTKADIAAAVDALRADLDRAGVGIRIAEVAQGYRLESPPACGAWLRVFLDRGRPHRLSPPALETLAIIAYRQPVTRSEIEAVRGVAVDQILRNLLDMQLIRVVGRSDLPGRPWLIGTSARFLEHFGLKSLDELPGVDELRRRDAAQAREAAQSDLNLDGAPAGDSSTGFNEDIDADRPGEDDVTAELSIADQSDAGDLPSARPDGAAEPPPDEIDELRLEDYEDDQRVVTPAPQVDSSESSDGAFEDDDDLEDDDDEFDDDDEDEDDDEEEEEADDEDGDSGGGRAPSGN